LKPATIALLDAGDVTEELVKALDANLRALMESWTPVSDLLDSSADDANFVAEMDDFGIANLRFGDGSEGRAVDVGMSFLATYRAGNGRAGLVGPEKVAQVLFRSGTNDVITSVRNPLPARGAVDPEPVAEVKMYAPTAFRTALERAVTAGDYATLAQYLRYPQRNPHVQSAAANLRWNGSWYEADVAVDAFGTPELKPALEKSISGNLHSIRRMGHDLRVTAADFVPLRLELDLCVKSDYLRAHVVSAVRDALSNRVLPEGRLGFFHPDNLTFGQAVFVSRIVGAVMAVDGVAEVEVVRLDRLAWELNHNPDLDKGLLKLGPTEVARLDNDPASPENGLLSFHSVRGGR
jgi:predicted phage baseplate assembly protein